MELLSADTACRVANASVSSGYVVALAIICLLQYAAHVHRIRRVRREKDRHLCELSGVASRLNTEQRERFLSQYENEVLREFLEERTGERALRRFLRRLVPDTNTGWAALLRRRDTGWCVVQCQGLDAESVESLRWDSNWDAALSGGETLAFSTESLSASELWKSLSAADRAKARRVYVFGLGSIGELEGALVTSELLPPGFDEKSRTACVEHLLGGISGSLRDRWRLDSQQRRLNTTAEMLALRGVADRNFDSPVTMLSELVQEVREKTLSHRAALFLYLPNQADEARPLVRVGEPFAPAIEQTWREVEQRLAERGRSLTCVAHYRGNELDVFERASPVGAALLAPILRRQRTVGLLCFTRPASDAYSEGQWQLGAWGANLLAETLPRAVDHAVTARHARLDPLTGLANRREFDRAIQDEIRLARDSATECSLLLLDLDRFKSINDTFGHRGGDAALQAAAKTILDAAKHIRVADREAGAASLAARYGGEELAVLLPGLGREAACRIGESLRSQFEALRIDFDGRQISLTASIGVATFPDHAEAPEELIAAADAALYMAKCAGRNRVAIADQALAMTPNVQSLRNAR